MFKSDLISKIDSLVRNSRNEKTLRMKTLLLLNKEVLNTKDWGQELNKIIKSKEMRVPVEMNMKIEHVWGDCERREPNSFCNELLHKRQQSPSNMSSSDNDSSSGRGDRESNKKKSVYKSQLSWYTTKITAEAREVDEN